MSRLLQPVEIPLWAMFLIAATIVLLVLILWSTKRRRRSRLDIEQATGMDDLLLSVVGITQGTLVEGNKIEIVENGAFFDLLFRELEAARDSIHFETFLCKEGEVTRRVADVLAKKAREGVAVRFIADGSGGRKFGKEGIRKMRDAGCQIAAYHPMRVSNIGVLNKRDHRKIVVIDGRVALVGGHCLVDSWLGDAQDKKHFRDLSARIEGPVVHQIQGAFCENWIEETGEVPGGDRFFPAPDFPGQSKAHAVFVSPHGMSSTVKLLHYMVIAGAQKQIRIQNPYFLPDPDGRKALVDAVKRGVDVRVMMPAAEASDSPLVQHASHHHFGTLLEGGVRIFEYQRTLLHQKVMTVDHCWSAIGSTNFDDRSFEVNDEISLGIEDENVARQLEEIFDRDLEFATECRLEEWKKRSVGHKLKDFSFYLVNEQL